jgi:hypothetical protein
MPLNIVKNVVSVFTQKFVYSVHKDASLLIENIYPPEKILNKKVLSGDSTVVMFSKAKIKLFWMKDLCIVNVLQIKTKFCLDF